MRNEIQKHKAQFLSVILIMAISLFVITMILNFNLEIKSTPLIVIQSFQLFVLISCLFILKIKKNFVLSSSIVVTLLVILNPVAVYLTGGISSPSILWSLIIIMLIFFLISGRLRYILIFVFTVLMSFSLFASRYNLFNVDVEIYSSGREFVFFLSLISTIYVVRYYDKLIREISLLQLKERERTKNLVAIMCHDIGNPIGLISTFSDPSFYEGSMDPRDSLVNIKKAADITGDIISSVREIESLRDGKKKLELSSVNLKDVLNDALFVLQDKLQEKEINLKVSGDLNINTLSDQSILSNNIFNNLITNSIKFSNYGSTIDVSVENVDDKVHLIIRDYGVGMPKSILDNLYRIDVATSRSGTNDELGAGYGMPLVKSSLYLLNSDIKVESWPEKEFPNNHGTKYTLILNLAK